MKDLTAKQKKVLDLVIEHIETNGWAPSVRELGQMVGINTIRGVTQHLRFIEQKGFIERESGSRMIRVLRDAGGNEVRHRLVGCALSPKEQP